MSQIEPVIRHMILCDDVQADVANPRKVNIFGLVSTIYADVTALFPLQHPEFCAYIEASAGRGKGNWQVAVEDAETEEVIFEGKPHAVVFGNDPLAVAGFVFRIEGCIFLSRGLYWVHVRWNGKSLTKQPLLVR